MAPRKNPEWTNSALTRHWSQIERVVGRKYMPVITDHSTRMLVAEEFGSGAFGTVIPTKTHGVVLKVTSDETEARFAAVAMSLGDWPKGMVRYYAALRLKGRHETRPIYALWREEAFEVGHVQGWFLRRPEDYTRAGYRLFRQRLDILQLLGWMVVKEVDPYAGMERRGRAKSTVDRSRVRAIAAGYRDTLTVSLRDSDEVEDRVNNIDDLTERTAYALALFEECALRISHEDFAPDVGEAIHSYVQRGLLLSDVHTGNVGRVHRRSGRSIAVITDPGVTVRLTASLDAIVPVAVERAKSDDWHRSA
jgi:hypothetical protein